MSSRLSPRENTERASSLGILNSLSRSIVQKQHFQDCLI
jgi:hypothetical protein